MFIMRQKEIKTTLSIIGMLALGLTSIYATQSFAAACTPSINPPAKNGKIPTKTIKIYNNSDDTIYPLFETNTNDVDEWLQAYFGTCDSSAFKHTLNYRIYVNGLEGVLPHHFVAMTVPLYTKLTAPNKPADPVSGANKYINWWNGGRIKIYNSPVTYADDFSKDQKARTFSDAVTCANVPGSACEKSDLDVYVGQGALSDAAPNQLTEYTFAGAPMSPDGNGLRTWAIQDVDWDVSYVDSVYLPIAMGVMGNKYIGYTGTVLDAPTFTQKMQSFYSQGVGNKWSHYIIPNNDSIIKLPGTYNYIRGVLNKTVSTPPADSPLTNLLILWRSCFPNDFNFAAIKDNHTVVPCTGTFKQDMQNVKAFFEQNLNQYKELSKDPSTGCDYAKFSQTLTDQNVPPDVEMLARIYGWVPFNDYCSGGPAVNSLCKTSTDNTDPALTNPDPTVCTQQYSNDQHTGAHQIYRKLEYSYTGTYSADKAPNFNPYVELIHSPDFLNMPGYAFSIDDAVGNMQESGNGLIIAVGGATGLENPNPYDPKSAIIVTLGKPQEKNHAKAWTKFDACPDDGSPCVPNSELPPNGTNFKLGTVNAFPLRVVIQDSNDNIYSFRISSGPDPKQNYTMHPDAVSDCKVTDKNGNEIVGWCANYVSPDIHGTPYAHTEKNENGSPVSYISANDTCANADYNPQQPNTCFPQPPQSRGR